MLSPRAQVGVLKGQADVEQSPASFHPKRPEGMHRMFIVEFGGDARSRPIPDIHMHFSGILRPLGATGDLDGLSAPGRKLRLYISPAKRRSRGVDARTRLQLSLFLCCSLFDRKGWGQSPQYIRFTFLIKSTY